ncbi:MAG: hypothetical protein HFE45_11405 [Oscillospiraceae bacterium]|jgi:Na+-translocating ferredoxin:NAD+ oxidoreductase RnfE subunit|nr:hypothetical protein [Oscillospiraceae bacterium]
MMEKKYRLERVDYLLLQNPVLERGLTIAPVIAAGTSVKNGLALSLAFALITCATIAAARFIPRRLPYTVRVIFNMLLASFVFIPAVLLTEWLLPGSIFNLGIYLPLLGTNSLIVQKSESRFGRLAAKEMLQQLLGLTAGFFLTMMAVCTLRETLGRGTFFDHPVGIPFTLPALLLPLGGFIITGFLAAALQALRLRVNSDAPAPPPRQDPPHKPSVSSDLPAMAGKKPVCP